jgi:hypothetical protein
MRLRFIGGPWDGEVRDVDGPRWHVHVPVPDPRPVVFEPVELGAGPFPPPTRREVVYVLGQLQHHSEVAGAEEHVLVDEERGRHQKVWIEQVMVEERLHRAELAAQETRERRDRLTVEMHRQGLELPEPLRFAKRNYLRATVWWCGDEYCNCTQARIEGWDYAYDLDGNAAEWPTPGVFVFPRFRDSDGRHGMLDTVWEGRFLSEGEPGAADDLVVVSEYLKAIAPELAAQIRWPWATSRGA